MGWELWIEIFLKSVWKGSIGSLKMVHSKVEYALYIQLKIISIKVIADKIEVLLNQNQMSKILPSLKM